jgi:hypothetical protein
MIFIDMLSLKHIIKKVLNEEEENPYADKNAGDNNASLHPYFQKRLKFINSIKSFHDIDNEAINKLIEYFAHEGFDTKEDAIYDLTSRIEEYKNFPDPVTLYRVIGVKNKKMINTKDLGDHYTPHLWNIDTDMLMSIGYENWEEGVKPYVMEVLVQISEIDIISTIIQNLNFPLEHEINLKNKGRNVKFVKAWKLKDF